MKAARTATAWCRSGSISSGSGSTGWRRRTSTTRWRCAMPGATLPILMYGSQLPDGFGVLIEHGLTPTVYSARGRAGAGGRGRRARRAGRRAREGRLRPRASRRAAGRRAGAGARGAVAAAAAAGGHLHAHPVRRRRPAPSGRSGRWRCSRRLVEQIEAEHGIRIDYTQASASSVLTVGFGDTLNTIAPGPPDVRAVSRHRRAGRDARFPQGAARAARAADPRRPLRGRRRSARQPLRAARPRRGRWA